MTIVVILLCVVIALLLNMQRRPSGPSLCTWKDYVGAFAFMMLPVVGAGLYLFWEPLVASLEHVPGWLLILGWLGLGMWGSTKEEKS